MEFLSVARHRDLRRSYSCYAIGITLTSYSARNLAISQNTPNLWIFVLEAQPLPDAREFNEVGGAFVLWYQMPGLAEDPVQHASEFLREAGWQVTGVQEEPRQIEREEAPEAEHFDQALIDDEGYVFHQWSVDDADDQTRH